MSESFEFVLDSVEASVIGQALGVEVRRFPLRFRHSTADPLRRMKLAALVTERLARRGLVAGDRLHPRLTEAFELFTEPRVTAAISGIDGLGADIAVLALTDGARALGVTQPPGGDELLFALFSDDDLVDVLAGVLPALRAAEGTPATVRWSVTGPRSALAARRAAAQRHDDEETAAFGDLRIADLVEPPAPRGHRADSDEHRLRRALAGRRLGGGHITVTGRGDRGAPHSVSWLDTETGRYLVHTEELGHDIVARYEPAGHHEVTRALRDAVSRAY
ncbi:ESAT-6 protein secretion system EspG family protein [Prauserella shujinwangii]|uniref:ESAT-6 protein secretion system EspG family protein n=1 Tax=Prauserella shujinwangii TaxID=1453103 RepID=A0A2T0M3I8_9PSEU|nr:ESX secretion-associated protein EspG [Prauserella shujinwangii]PRX51308.1 ESAT-6 protein secretion system EspG family protein [Prauserella shujinwangii]